MNRLHALRRIFYAVTLGSCVLLLTSCGRSFEPTYPLSGTLTYNGQPLAGATIIFYPQGGAALDKKLFPTGVSDQSGNFQVCTYSKSDVDGAPEGDYKICVYYPPPGQGIDRAGDPADGEEDGPTRLSSQDRNNQRLSDYIKKTYYNIQTTPLATTVGTGPNQPIKLELK